MLYRPKFCCQCGDAIERENWKLWESRRFCELCKTEFMASDWIPRISVGIGFIFGIFFIGSFFQGTGKNTNESPVNNLSGSQINQGKLVQKPENQNVLNPDNLPENKNLVATPSIQTQTNRQIAVLTTDLEQRSQAEKLKGQQNKKQELVYFCGAETKKGTPCTRRVKGGGRCWQHEGKDAMLPENQLSASQ